MEPRAYHPDAAPASQTKSRTTFGQLMAGVAVKLMIRKNNRGANYSRYVLLMTHARTVVSTGISTNSNSGRDTDRARSGLDSCGLGFVMVINLLNPLRPSVHIDVKMQYEGLDIGPLNGTHLNVKGGGLTGH